MRHDTRANDISHLFLVENHRVSRNFDSIRLPFLLFENGQQAAKVGMKERLSEIKKPQIVYAMRVDVFKAFGEILGGNVFDFGK